MFMPAGRPCKLTPEIQKRIVTALHAGNYIETAAAYAGISKDTLYRWLKQGARSKSGVFHAFSAAVEEAMAKSEVRDVTLIAKAAEKEWQAAAWRLERKYPDRWGRRRVIQGTGSIDGIGDLAESLPGESPVGTQLRIAESMTRACAARGDLQGLQFWQEQVRKLALAQKALADAGGPGSGSWGSLQVNNYMVGVDDGDPP